jgi:hypothetical protein
MVSGTGGGAAGREGQAMKKVLLALTILGAGAGAFHTQRQSTKQHQDEAATLRESLMMETQRLTAMQTEQAGLAGHVGEIKQTLARIRPMPENELWSALQTNRADRLPRKLREQLRDELGFTWHSLPDYIVVSKKTVRNLGIQFIDSGGRFNDAALGALVITPDERRTLETALEKARTDFKDWVLGHVQRIEPADDVVAGYSLPGDAATARNLTNDFFTAVNQAVGEERTQLMRKTALAWMNEMGVSEHSTRLMIKREMVGDETRLKVELRQNGRNKSAYLPMNGGDFPKALRILFPGRWTDLAKQEGFELPKKLQKKE